MTKKSFVSSRLGKLRRVKNSNIIFTKKAAKELKAIRKRKINSSDRDVPEITNWNAAIVGKFYRPHQKNRLRFVSTLTS